WDPIREADIPLAPALNWLSPPLPSPHALKAPGNPVVGLSPHAEAAIESACDRIFGAGPGVQEITLNGKCFALGTLAGAGRVPADIALSALLRAAHAMPSHDSRRPWRYGEVEAKVERAFAAGRQHPCSA